MQSIYHSSYIIYVSQLSEKPNCYFVLENPDAPVLKAMSSQDYVSIGSPEETQIDDLINAKEISYLEYNGTYYVAGFSFETKSPPPIPFLFILAGSVISASTLLILASLKTISYVRKEKDALND
jgi:hypothetical protein